MSNSCDAALSCLADYLDGLEIDIYHPQVDRGTAILAHQGIVLSCYVGGERVKVHYLASISPRECQIDAPGEVRDATQLNLYVYLTAGKPTPLSSTLFHRAPLARGSSSRNLLAI